MSRVEALSVVLPTRLVVRESAATALFLASGPHRWCGATGPGAHSLFGSVVVR